jgi:adenine-specific DNA-methyltransferase
MRQHGRVFKSAREGKNDYYFLDGEQLVFYSQKTRLINNKRTTVAAATNVWDDILSNNLHNEGGVSFPNGKKPEFLIKHIGTLNGTRRLSIGLVCRVRNNRSGCTQDAPSLDYG